MKKIEWLAGYYEWHLLIDNKLVYVENDTFLDSLSDDHIINGQILASEAESVVSYLIDYIRYRFIEEFEDSNIKEFLDNDALYILKSLTDEEWDIVEKTIFRAYCFHYGIVDRRFKYGNREFEAVGNFKGGFTDKTNKMLDYKRPNYQEYNIKDFYKVAKKHKASCDIYRIIGDYDNYYMLCGSSNVGAFIKVDVSNQKDIKTCDEYSRWYR